MNADNPGPAATAVAAIAPALKAEILAQAADVRRPAALQSIYEQVAEPFVPWGDRQLDEDDDDDGDGDGGPVECPHGVSITESCPNCEAEGE